MHNVWNNFYRTKEFAHSSPVFRTFFGLCRDLAEAAFIFVTKLLSAKA